MTSPAPASFNLKAWSKAFFSGTFSHDFFTRRFVPFMFGFLIGCLVLANLFFPRNPDGSPGYIPFDRTISGQGNHGDNPVGAWFFVIGLIGTSILLVPFNIYAWRRISAACKGAAGVALFFTIAGAVGFAMVGIWDERSTCLLLDGTGNCILRSSDVHDVGSATAFGGNLLSILVYMFPMMKYRVKTGKNLFHAWGQVAHVVSFIAFFGIMALVQNASGIPPFFTAWSFWQWCLFLALAGYYISLAMRLPPAVPPPVAVRARGAGKAERASGQG